MSTRSLPERPMTHGPLGRAMVVVASRTATRPVHWDGNAWSEINNPNSGILLGVTTSSTSDACAVGDGFNARSGYPTGTYTLHYTVP